MQDLSTRLDNKCNYVCLSASNNSMERDNILRHLVEKNTFIKIVLITPETLQDTIIKDTLAQVKINRIIVDEGHCVDECGHQVRPSYLCLGNLKDKLNVQIVAFTATATARTTLAIQTLLHMKNAFVIKGSFWRNNLFLDI